MLSVGPVPEKAIHSIMPELQVEQLLYGVEDIERKAERAGRQDKVCFVTIGSIEERKGQDVLLQAVCLLPEEIRSNAVFYLIGNDTSLLAEQIKEKARAMPEFVLTGGVGREKIHEILEKADVTGTASYIQEGKRGLIFENGNVGELTDKIRWCIENRTVLAEMGKRAREIYESIFSMKRFEEEVNKVICKSLDNAFPLDK